MCNKAIYYPQKEILMNNIGFIETYKSDLYGVKVDYCLESRKRLSNGNILIFINLIKDENKRNFIVYYLDEYNGKELYANEKLVCNYKNPFRSNVKKYLEKCYECFDEKTLTFDPQKAHEYKKVFTNQQITDGKEK